MDDYAGVSIKIDKKAGLYRGSDTIHPIIARPTEVSVNALVRCINGNISLVDNDLNNIIPG